jgi:membrane protein YdbS with pleckstrin-like domain
MQLALMAQNRCTTSTSHSSRFPRMTIFAQLLLFISSFSPLFAVFALLDSLGSGWPSRACAIVAAVGLLVPLIVIPVARKRISPTSLNAVSSQIRDGDTLAYIATYLIPFAAIQAITGRERFALAIFVLMITVIYVRSELFYINPFLAIVGYRLFQVTTPKGSSVVLISRRRFLPANISIHARRISGYVWWESSA